MFAKRPILKPADIERHTLLASETRPGDWANRLVPALPHLVRRPRKIFDRSTRQAVEDGLGIGVGPLPTLAIDIASRRLTTPLPDILFPRTGYVSIIPQQAESGKHAASFVDWLVGEPQGAVGDT
ncbi:LysR substrate-binding domain-containing protein [Xanthobacter flavus]|uniref:LysR substrate-binding domain-containing protein n=1 Tax=Xanthobacter flavus TaxID=281 RepID=UPI00372B5B34